MINRMRLILFHTIQRVIPTVSCADPEGDRGPDPHHTLEITKYRVSWQSWSGSLEK